MQFDEKSFFKKYLTEAQLEECVEIQKMSPNEKSLFIIAIEKGYINDKNLQTILKELSLQGQQPKPAPKPKRKLFGELCVEKGFATPEQIKECLALQKKLKEAGKHFRLGQILIEKKYVAVRQAQKVLEIQGKKILRCIPCDTKYNIRSYKPEKKYHCPKCRGPLTSSMPGANVMKVDQSFATRDSIDVDDEALSIIGKKIGEYELVALLGEGGMADVYKAVNPLRKKPRALKIMKPQTGIDRFNREFESAHALRHPHIIRVYETGKIDGRSYFFMEYVDGGTLEKRIQKMGVIPLLEGLTVLKQVAIALKYAHESGIVHRDVKPSNILLSRTRSREIEAKITDFGIAKPVTDSQITVGHLVGTFKYMSPEYIRGMPIDGKNDVFALGIVAYEMFTGKEPFKVDDPVGYLFVNIKETPPPVDQINPDLPKEVSLIVDRMLSKDTRKRYDTSALLRDINRYIQHLTMGTSLVDVDDATSVFREKKGFFMLKEIWDKISQSLPWKATEDADKEAQEIILDPSELVNFSETEEIGKDDTARQNYELAVSLADKGDLEGALKNLQALMEFFPGSPWSHRARKQIKAIKAKLREGKTPSAVQKKKSL